MSVPATGDLYFQGLLSQKLGQERLVDDELISLILEDCAFRKLCDEYVKDDDENGVVSRVRKKAEALQLPSYAGVLKSSHNWAVWAAVLDDPRFDLIWKSALDELKEPLPVVRNSMFARVLQLLAKLKPMAGTATALPWILGTAAVTSVAWVAPVLIEKTAKKEPPGTVIPPTEQMPFEASMSDLNKNLTAIQKSLDRLKGGGPSPTPPTIVNVDFPPASLAPLAIQLKAQTQVAQNEMLALRKAIEVQRPAAIDLAATNHVLQRLDDDAQRLATVTKVLAEASQQSASAEGRIDTTVSAVRGDQVNAANLSNALRAPRVSIQDLRKGNQLVLTNGSRCFKISIQQMDGHSTLVRTQEISCQSSSSTQMAAPQMLLLTAAPRLVPSSDGRPATGLYLSLEVAIHSSVIPFARRRLVLGVYSLEDWRLEGNVRSA